MESVRFFWIRRLSSFRFELSYPLAGGSRFHPEIVSTDPYSKMLIKSNDGSYLGSLSELQPAKFEWGDTTRNRVGFEQLVVSELDLTDSKDDLNKNYGTKFLPPPMNSLSDRISAMASSGVNGVVMRRALVSDGGKTGGALCPFNFFAPNCDIFKNPAADLKDLIKTCHIQSIEVYLEVNPFFTVTVRLIWNLI